MGNSLSNDAGVSCAMVIADCKNRGLVVTEQQVLPILVDRAKKQNAVAGTKVIYNRPTKCWKLTIDNALPVEPKTNFANWLASVAILGRHNNVPTGREPKKDTHSLQHILAESTTKLIRTGEITLSDICDTAKKTPDWIFKQILPQLKKHLTPNGLFEVTIESRESGEYIVLKPCVEKFPQPLVEEQKSILTGFVKQRVVPLLQFLNSIPNPAEKIRQQITPAQLRSNEATDEVSSDRQKLFWVLIEVCSFEQKTEKQILESLGILPEEAHTIHQFFTLITTTTESQPLSLQELQKILCLNYRLFKLAFVPAETPA